jgi:hypothetical protein
MCDPTVLAIGSTVAGLAGKAVDYFGEQSAAADQKKAYDDWSAQQRVWRRDSACGGLRPTVSGHSRASKGFRT